MNKHKPPVSIKPVLQAHLAAMPEGASITQLCALTGASRKQVAGSLERGCAACEVFVIQQQKSSVYFSTPDRMEAARPAVVAARAAEAAMYTERQRRRGRVRTQKFRSGEYLERQALKYKQIRAEARAASGLSPIGTKSVTPRKPRKPANILETNPPKLKRGRQLSIKATQMQSGSRAGWNDAEPRITADTIITIYVPTVWGRAAAAPMQSYGPTCAEQHAQRMAAIESRRDAEICG